MFGPALSLVAASYTGCSAPLTVGLLSMGVGLMGGTMSGYRINHLDISPRFAGILMSLTNCIANVFALLAPLIAGFIIEGKVSTAFPGLLHPHCAGDCRLIRLFRLLQPTQAAWRVVFFISAAVYAATACFYLIFASGDVQEWDDPDKDAYQAVEIGANGQEVRRRSRRDSQLEQAETQLQTA